MAGDRRCSYSWSNSFKCPHPKIRKHPNGMLIGASGDGGLCKLVVDILELPKIETDPLTYMFWVFLPNLNKLLLSQPGYRDEHKLLRFGVDEYCSALVGIKGELYDVCMFNPEEEVKECSLSRIVVDDAPLPFAVGCGSSAAIPILLAQSNELGYNTKEELARAMQIAAEISPGCDAHTDFISE